MTSVTCRSTAHKMKLKVILTFAFTFSDNAYLTICLETNHTCQIICNSTKNKTERGLSRLEEN